MIHLRVVSPPDLTERALALLTGDRGAVNLVVLPSAARHPDGDAIECDLGNTAANAVLRDLRVLGVDRSGSIVLEPVEVELSDPDGDGSRRGAAPLAQAPVWEEVETRIRAEATYGSAFYLFLVVAGLIGAVGILTNSEILIVGAMVVGPEYGAICSVVLGLDRRSWPAVRRGLAALLLGFAAAVVAAFLFAWLVRVTGREPRLFQAGVRPVSALIDNPNLFSLVVAVLAGVVGMVSLVHARTSTLLGVFISVTTIPAASDIGVAGASGSWSEARGSGGQLLLNILVLVVVGLLVLRLLRTVWHRIALRGGGPEDPGPGATP